MARTDNLTNFLTDVANAIREKKGTYGEIPASEFDMKIREISSSNSEATGGADLSEYFTEIISAGTNSVAGYINTIKKIPLMTISGTSCDYMFQACPFPEIPLLDTSRVTSMNYMFRNSAIERIPLLDTSNVTNMASMFSGSKVTEVPNLNTSKVKSMGSMFYGSKIVNAPEMDTSQVTSMASMFRECENLVSVPSYNTSQVTSMAQMFYGCRKLEQIGEYDTQNVTNMNGLFYNVDKLTKIPNLNTSNVTNMSMMFYGFGNYSEVPLLDCGNVTNIDRMFDVGKSTLTTLGGFKDLGKAYLTTQSADFQQYRLDLDNLNNLTEQSIINVLDNLYDIASKGCATQKVSFGSSNLNKLTSEAGQTALANARAKGWTIV